MPSEAASLHPVSCVTPSFKSPPADQAFAAAHGPLPSLPVPLGLRTSTGFFIPVVAPTQASALAAQSVLVELMKDPAHNQRPQINPWLSGAL